MKYKAKPQYEDYHDTYDVGESALAAAIVMQAVEDYRYAKGYLNGDIKMTIETWKSKYIRKPEFIISDVIEFFNSRWYGTLCDIPKERILEKLWRE